MTALDTSSLPEAKLWYAAIRQAITDLLHGHDGLAIDAVEFLDSTGAWLAWKLWGVPEHQTRQEVGRLLEQRNRERGYSLKVKRDG